MVKRGEIWWASLPAPQGSPPGYRQPVVIIQSNDFNESRIQTVVVAAITSNLGLAAAPGNVAISARGTGLSRKSVINVSQLLTVTKLVLTKRVGRLDSGSLQQLDEGLRLVLAL